MNWQYYWRKNEETGETDCGVYYEDFPGRADSVCRAPRYQTEEQWEKDASLICSVHEMQYLLRRILGDLPLKRDWLDPEIEKRIKQVV